MQGKIYRGPWFLSPKTERKRVRGDIPFHAIDTSAKKLFSWTVLWQKQGINLKISHRCYMFQLLRLRLQQTQWWNEMVTPWSTRWCMTSRWPNRLKSTASEFHLWKGCGKCSKSQRKSTINTCLRTSNYILGTLTISSLRSRLPISVAGFHQFGLRKKNTKFGGLVLHIQVIKIFDHGCNTTGENLDKRLLSKIKLLWEKKRKSENVEKDCEIFWYSMFVCVIRFLSATLRPLILCRCLFLPFRNFKDKIPMQPFI